MSSTELSEIGIMRYIDDPHKAELNAEAQLRAWGFADAVATTGGADGGVDVRSKRALAQVKFRGSATGRPSIQMLYGARGSSTSEQLFFFSGSGYSRQAIEYADSVGMSLLIYDPTGHALPANEVARKFLKTVGVSSPRPVLLNMDDYVIRGGLLVGAVLLGFLLWLALSAGS